MVSIQNKAQIENLLTSLDIHQKPVWGSMQPQQMIEHLSLSVKGSYLSKAQLAVPEEKAIALKQAFIYSDMELPRGIKSSMYKDGELPPLRFASKDAAIEVLLKEIDAFYAFFEEHQERLTMNPVVGLLNLREWEVFHGKHFLHHFKQFQLI